MPASRADVVALERSVDMLLKQARTHSPSSRREQHEALRREMKIYASGLREAFRQVCTPRSPELLGSKHAQRDDVLALKEDVSRCLTKGRGRGGLWMGQPAAPVFSCAHGRGRLARTAPSVAVSSISSSSASRSSPIPSQRSTRRCWQGASRDGRDQGAVPAPERRCVRTSCNRHEKTFIWLWVRCSGVFFILACRSK
eukprot:3562322-Pleurochrysis_carterae.AAC.6